jgi:hypothetical protein
MAYTQGAVVKTAEAAPDRQNMITYAWSDTDVQAGSEATVDNLPKRGIIKRFTARLTSGTGTTINPSIGRAAGFSPNTQDQVLAAPGAAAHVDAGPVYYFSGFCTRSWRTCARSRLARSCCSSHVICWSRPCRTCTTLSSTAELPPARRAK